MRMPEPIPEDCVCDRCVPAIDSSVSMGVKMSGSFFGTRLEVAGEAICRFVQRKLEIEAEDPANTGALGLVSFNSSAQEIMDLTPIREAEAEVRRAVQSMRPEASTDFCSGLALSWELLRRDHPAPRYPDVGFVDRIIFLSDSEHNGPGDPLQLAEEIKRSGVLIFTIGVSDEIDEDGRELLRRMASVVDGEPWFRHVSGGCDELIDCFAGLAGQITR